MVQFLLLERKYIKLLVKNKCIKLVKNRCIKLLKNKCIR